MKRKILVDANIQTKNGNKTVKALIDSGANMTMVSKHLVEEQKLEKTKRDQAVIMRNADGSPNINGKLTDNSDLTININGHEEMVTALGSDISSADIFLVSANQPG